MEEKEIYVLVCGEEKIQKEDLGMNMQDDVGFFVTVVAYVDVETNEFKKENQKLCWSKDKNEFSGKFKDKKIYKVKVEVNPYSKEMDLKEILEEDCHEKRLEDVVYHFKDKVEWKFKGQIYLLNRTQDAFVSVQAINDDDCIIQLKVDEEYGDTAYKSLKTWEKILNGNLPFLKTDKNYFQICMERVLGIIDLEKKAKIYAANKIIEDFYLWEQEKLNKQGGMLKEETLMEHLKVVCIVISDLNFEIFYDLKGSNVEQNICVFGNIQNGFEKISLVK